jgi:hypothetical protein
VVASRWWSEKLKAAIHERVLARSLCDASSSTGPCGTPFRRPAGFRISSVPAAVIAQRRRFDVIMAWAIDRPGCSAIDLLGTIQTLEACGVDLYLDQQSIDAMTPAGRLMFQVTGAFAEFERSTIRQRVRGGLARAAEKGSVSGAQEIDVATEAQTQARLRAGVGIIKAVRECSVGVGNKPNAGSKAKPCQRRKAKPQSSPLPDFASDRNARYGSGGHSHGRR